MKIIKVVYTTKPEFVEQNQNNIKSVMNQLQKINNPGINYFACLGADGKTFTHTAFYESDENQKILTELPEFKYFQEQLKASVPENPPKQELLQFIAASRNIFN